MSSTKCLSCGSAIEIDFQAFKGDFIECDECGMEFEIVATSPIKIDWVEYDDDDEFEDEDY
jgi:alpha-aminoadipate carrier protein LysW